MARNPAAPAYGFTPDELAATPLKQWPTRELILHHAARLLAVRGYHGTATRDIASAVGIRQPSLFHHFATKLAIVDALLAFDLDAAHAFSGYLRDQPGSAAVRLFRYILWDISYCVASPFDLRGLHGDDVMEAPELNGWRSKLDEFHEHVRAIIEQGVERGEFARQDPEFARQAITGLTMETIRLHGAGKTPSGGADRPDRAASFAVRALLADPQRLDEIRRAAHDSADAPWPIGTLGFPEACDAVR